MWGRIVQIVGLVLLVIVAASVVSPWSDLQLTTLRTSKRAMTQVGLAIPPLLPGALPVPSTFLAGPRTLQLHPAYDIVARDCARLC